MSKYIAYCATSGRPLFEGTKEDLEYFNEVASGSKVIHLAQEPVKQDITPAAANKDSLKL
ncbi:MAG: hypothetical protein CO093_11325 [Alphaproteobacteria bacterium CG_4_9_14_3_um_filter_47_13]|nr:MAG: hypothetical protein CO093_11325 [Alphaproteobacteria bacterium CG_4_9_14_3_um_filter_47_13]